MKTMDVENSFGEIITLRDGDIWDNWIYDARKGWLEWRWIGDSDVFIKPLDNMTVDVVDASGNVIESFDYIEGAMDAAEELIKEEKQTWKTE